MSPGITAEGWGEALLWKLPANFFRPIPPFKVHQPSLELGRCIQIIATTAKIGKFAGMFLGMPNQPKIRLKPE